ncbi:MAG: MATE family efflux transporter [Eubacteriales bacterium]|nr:MATE family efflux transporter [Eubacteriales bacterium]
MNSETKTGSRMGTEPVGSLMIRVGLPIVLSMMLQAVYNIVDSAYLSNMREAGEEALTALGLAFPIQLLMVAAAIGTGVGTNALLSKSMGQGNRGKVNQVAGNATFLGIVIFIIFLVFGLTGVPAYVNSQSAGGAISETVLLMAIDYLQICCCISFGIVFFSIYEKMLQATGRSLYSTIAQIAGAVVNIVLDPIMIYGWLGCPELGVRGAAYATVIGQIVSAVLVFFFHYKLNVEIDKSPRYLRPQREIIGEIYAIGLPAILSQALLTVMTYGLNIILGQMPQVGENAVTVYGLYCKIQQLIIFAAVGMRDAITPIVSFNFGMRNKARVREGIRDGLLFTAVLMVIGLVLIEVIAEPLTGFFSLSDVTYAMCVDCMRIVSLAFIFAGLCIAFQGVFQAIECGIESLLISLGRQVVFILPVAWILVRQVRGAENASIVWWTFLIGEALTLLCTVWMYRRAVKKKIGAMADTR